MVSCNFSEEQYPDNSEGNLSRNTGNSVQYDEKFEILSDEPFNVKPDNIIAHQIENNDRYREIRRLRNELARLKRRQERNEDRRQIQRIRERRKQVERQIKEDKQRAAIRRKEFLRRLEYERQMVEAFEEILFEATSTTATT
uniref:BZIP domain-containing protein n=1 Tax=Parastrongyloides trichosuri TaxID=131310 RepID=A0A0N4ZW42_PARTI